MAVARGALGKRTPWYNMVCDCLRSKQHEKVTDPRQVGHIRDLHDGGALLEVRTNMSGSQIRGTCDKGGVPNFLGHLAFRAARAAGNIALLRRLLREGQLLGPGRKAPLSSRPGRRSKTTAAEVGGGEGGVRPSAPKTARVWLPTLTSSAYPHLLQSCSSIMRRFAARIVRLVLNMMRAFG